jgi:hypothetical protein
MYSKRVQGGVPWTFQELIFFSPRQFNEPEPLEFKDFIYYLKICVNSGRVFTGAFFGESIDQGEVDEKTLKQVLKMVNETPDIIICGQEYTIYDETNSLNIYYGQVLSGV